MKDIIHFIEKKIGLAKPAYQPVDLNMLKLNVIHGNEYEINKTKDELNKLKSDLESFSKLYCKQYGHSYFVYYYYRAGKTGWHSFCGDEVIYHVSYKCSVCGSGYSSEYPRRLPRIEKKVCEFPDSAYDDKNLQIDGRTYRMVKEEISRLEDYLAYRYSLKNKICELVGHTVDEHDCCVCCGLKIFLGNNNDDLNSNPKTFTRETFLLLPTFEEYRNEIIRSKNENHSENGSPQKIIKKYR